MVGQAVIQKKKKSNTTERYTIEEYFQLEEKSVHKNEFVNSKIVPIT